MKRKALLIGNTQGLAGVQTDIKKTESFLRSDTGGAWFGSEIDVFTNPRRTDLLAHVARIRQSSPDYVFLLFSGHGGAEKRTTILELNGMGETIPEDMLFDISSRQTSIFDCCRVVVQESYVKAHTADRRMALESVSTVRQRFDARILQAIPQQVRLYACSIGQASNDTPDGAIYLQNLLNAAKSLSYNEMFKTAEQAHSEATTVTVAATANLRNKQTPEAFLPKCLTSQRLILSVRP